MPSFTDMRPAVIMPPLVKRFREAYPHVEVELRNVLTTDQLALLQERKLRTVPVVNPLRNWRRVGRGTASLSVPLLSRGGRSSSLLFFIFPSVCGLPMSWGEAWEFNSSLRPSTMLRRRCAIAEAS